MSDTDIRDAAVGEFEKTTDPYPTWVRKGKPSSSHWAKGFALLGQIGAATPPPAGWVVAPPQKPVTTITNPPGLGINLHTASDPKTVSDTIVQGGANTAYEIQPGAPNRTLQRCQAFDVAAAKNVTYGCHAVYAKAAGITVLDFTATASRNAANGLSVRYPGFLGQRCQLDDFPIPLAVFADDTTKGTITWRQIRGRFGTVGVWLDVDEAAKMVYDIVLDQVDLDGPSWFLNANASVFAGTVTITGCTLNGKPVARTDCNGVPTAKLTVS